VRLEELTRTSADVASTRSRLAKVRRLADCLARLAPDEAPIAVAYLSGVLPQGSIGVGWASLRSRPPGAPEPGTLTLLEVDAMLSRIASATGPGSRGLRRALLDELFGRATDSEQDFLVRLLTGELRQGALERIVVEALAQATGAPPAAVRRAVMVAGDLGAVAAALLGEGPSGLSRFRLEVFKPVGPMLAQTAADLGEALARISPAAIEYKLDGARVQVHRKGAEVRAYTRNLADVTARLPEVVETVARLPLDSVVLDGEVIALRHDERRPQLFQVTMSRFGTQLGVEAGRSSVPLFPFFFDCLHLDGDDLIDRGTAARGEALAARVPPELVIPRIVTDSPERAAAMLEEALAQGHEGVMVKAPDAPYEAGRRGASWLKVKRAYTLDLVVLAAEWGHGRRRGWLSNLHLGARAETPGEFVMLGKTFKGLTDEMLAWQTARLLELETERAGITVFVRPELVVEVAIDGVQRSVRYPGGVALRFARVKGYRPDKTAADADTIETVRAIHEGRM
jgi:ATP-dependent DNA ligase I